MRPLEIILILLIVLFFCAVVGWQVFKRVRAKKTGKPVSPCCGDCGGCSGCASAKPDASVSNESADGDDSMPEISVRSNVTCDLTDVAKNLSKQAK